ncbi:potassium channel family protein [Streptomyces sp. NPDC014864]|uniref:potassium channel family protein n=1 Tax=Streptomyces sp. NPDC014864 TaxID=3364924 RepID=UPI0036F770D4
MGLCRGRGLGSGVLAAHAGSVLLLRHVEAVRALGTGGRSVYLSLVTVATLGLGDIAPSADWLRIVAPLEAMVGFVLLTATVSWILGIYPALARRRALALRISQLRRAGPAAGRPASDAEPARPPASAPAGDPRGDRGGDGCLRQGAGHRRARLRPSRPPPETAPAPTPRGTQPASRSLRTTGHGRVRVFSRNLNWPRIRWRRGGMRH